MPYIKDIRGGFRDLMRPKVGVTPDNAGELNFQITSIIHNFLEKRGISYRTLNDAIGALECAKLELYRRLAAPYEDQKVRENGDVLPFNSPERAN